MQHCSQRRTSTQSVPTLVCHDDEDDDNATSDGQEKFKQSDVYYSFHHAAIVKADNGVGALWDGSGTRTIDFGPLVTKLHTKSFLMGSITVLRYQNITIEPISIFQTPNLN